MVLGGIFFNDNHVASETMEFLMHRYIQYRVVLACSQLSQTHYPSTFLNI